MLYAPRATFHAGTDGQNFSGTLYLRPLELGHTHVVLEFRQEGNLAALAFARTLYAQLAEGARADAAVRAARVQARRDGDPSWLAYSLYAHSHAQIIASYSSCRSRVRRPADGAIRVAAR